MQEQGLKNKMVKNITEITDTDKIVRCNYKSCLLEIKKEFGTIVMMVGNTIDLMEIMRLAAHGLFVKDIENNTVKLHIYRDQTLRDICINRHIEFLVETEGKTPESDK